VEQIHFVSKNLLNLPSKPRLHFQGTTAGNVMGPVNLPDLGIVPQLTYRAKKELYGDAAMSVPSGDGTNPDAQEGAQDPPKRKRSPDDIEASFYHTMLPELTEEIVHMLGGRKKIKAIIDATPGTGILAHLCVKERIPYLGFSFTPSHQAKLMKWVSSSVWADYTKPGTVLYDEELSAALVEESAEAEEQPDKPAPATGKGRGRGRGRGRGKAKAKADGMSKAIRDAKAAAGKKRPAEDLDDDEDPEGEPSEPADSGDDHGDDDEE